MDCMLIENCWASYSLLEKLPEKLILILNHKTINQHFDLNSLSLIASTSFSQLQYIILFFLKFPII